MFNDDSLVGIEVDEIIVCYYDGVLVKGELKGYDIFYLNEKVK